MYVHVSYVLRSENPIRILRVGNFSDAFDDVFYLLTSGLSKNKEYCKFFTGHTKVLEKFHILFCQMKKQWVTLDKIHYFLETIVCPIIAYVSSSVFFFLLLRRLTRRK